MTVRLKIIATLLLLFVSAPVFAVETSRETASSESGKGDVQFSIVSSPLLGSVPRGATRVEMAVINISASCEADIVLEEIEITHIGLGDSSDIAALYLYNGQRRVSRARTFDAHARKAQLRPTSLVIKKCDAVRLQVLVDIASDAQSASEHGVTIAGVSALSSSAKTTTFLPVDSTERRITSPKDIGSITANFLPIKGPLRYGHTETVARLQLTADSSNDHLLRSIVFTNLGDARDMNLLNFTLETRMGSILGPPALRMRGLQVMLTFDPTYVLERGRTVVFLLKAQINASRSRKVNFTIQEPSDLYATPYRASR